jgi:DNA primase
MSALMSDVVQQIKDRLNIVDVVSSYVELQKAGRHFKARCPFHSEKTPSFNISPERGMYHCYGCGAGGDVFTFVQEIEGVDFKEALKILAGKAGVELVPVSPQKKNERDRMYSVLEEATNFFEHSLTEGSPAKEYIEKRGVTLTTSLAWRLGYVPGSETIWRATKDYLLNKGYTENEILKCGLIKNSDKGKDSYDVFRNRVMFPIFDQGGRVVAFSGRTLEKKDDVPKYVNSPETDLFKKSEILYGYHKAKHGIRQLDFSLIVEGQFDVVMSHQAGYSNTVAVSGTALTLQHVQLLERLSKRVVLALDADKAGISAVKKAADLMLRRGLDVKVAVMPDGKDPADIILNDTKEFKKIIGNSIHVIEFLLLILTKAGLDERTFKLRAREEVIPYILLLPNKIDQDHFETKVAEALKTTKEAVHYEVERFLELEEHSSKASSVKEFLVDKKTSEKEVGNNRFETLLNYLFGTLPLLPEEVSERIYQEIEKITGNSKKELEEKISLTLSNEVTFRAEVALDQYPRRIFEEEIIHSLNQLREVVVRDRLKIAKEELQKIELSDDQSGLEECMKKVTELQEARKLAPFTIELVHKK